jgi:FAD:protein FMN transferase
MEYHEFRAMNTAITLAAEGERETLESAFQETQAFIEDCEERLSRFRETSELSQLNRSAGKWFQASPLLYKLMKIAQSCHFQTGGLFDPAILPALQRAGYNRSMDEIRRVGSWAGSQAGSTPVEFGSFALIEDGFGAVQFDERDRSVLLPEGMQVDLGGIAKGWIAEEAAGILNRYAPACGVNAGGDLFLMGRPQGRPQGQTGWEIGLEDPRDPERDVALLVSGPGAVATSSVTKRQWKQGETIQHHLIDPRSGRPAQTAWLSATIYAPHGALAEVFAKAVLIAGPQQAGEMLAHNPDLALVAVDREANIWVSTQQNEGIHVYDSSAIQL